MSGSEAEREHAPSEKRLSDARKRGEFARSADLNAAAVYGGFFVAAWAFGTAGARLFGTAGQTVLSLPHGIADVLSARAGSAPLGQAISALLTPAIPLLVLPGVAVLALLLAFRGVVFAPTKIMPRLSRIDPLATARQKFGRAGLFEFSKSLAKIIIVGMLLASFLRGRIEELVATQMLEPAMASAMMMQMLMGFIAVVAGVWVALGAVDYLWQYFEHIRRNRMSRQEMVDEHKEAEGDPHMKAQRQQRAREIATNRMLQDVARADVVIVNPTHYAVALCWSRGSGRAPVCVAKGVDEIAARIREKATLAGVPLRSDPPTARAIHARVEIGQEIRPEHYAAVAAAIRFAEAMRKKARARGA